MQAMLGGPVLADAVGGTLSGEQTHIRAGEQEVSVTVLATYAVEGGCAGPSRRRPLYRKRFGGVGCSFGHPLRQAGHQLPLGRRHRNHHRLLDLSPDHCYLRPI
jgi:hypothetical protein